MAGYLRKARLRPSARHPAGLGAAMLLWRAVPDRLRIRPTAGPEPFLPGPFLRLRMGPAADFPAHGGTAGGNDPPRIRRPALRHGGGNGRTRGPYGGRT